MQDQFRHGYKVESRLDRILINGVLKRKKKAKRNSPKTVINPLVSDESAYITARFRNHATHNDSVSKEIFE